MLQEKEAAGTRTRILDIARDLIAAQGYSSTSIAQIAEKLGTSKAALYYHFKSKEEILDALLGEPFEAMKDLRDACTRPGAKPEEVLGGLIDCISGPGSCLAIFENDESRRRARSACAESSNPQGGLAMPPLDPQTATLEAQLAPVADPRRWKALAVLALVQFMIVIDVTVVNVALPSIQKALHFSAGGLAWIVDGYALMAGGLLLLGGRTGDLLGRRRLFLIGTGVFAVASVVSGAAQSQGMR